MWRLPAPLGGGGGNFLLDYLCGLCGQREGACNNFSARYPNPPATYDFANTLAAARGFQLRDIYFGFDFGFLVFRESISSPFFWVHSEWR